MVAIICMKWGKEFTAHHVNTLYASVLRNMEEPFAFVCLTDDDRDLAKDILACPSRISGSQNKHGNGDAGPNSRVCASSFPA